MENSKEPKVEITHSNIIKSDELNELATALAKAQSKLGSVHKGEKGYGYNYASLASTIETSKEPLTDNGLSVSQLLGEIKDNKVSITTMLIHSSGQYLGSTSEVTIIDMKGCNEAQNQGASESYGRRYALQAILNMASEDNDASSNGPVKQEPKSSPKKQASPTPPPANKGGFGRSPKVK